MIAAKTLARLGLSLAAIALVGAGTDARADSEKARLRNELGIIHSKNGHLDDALRYFSLNLAEQSDSPSALNNAANVYFLQSEYERARELYQRAIEAAPEEGGIHLNLGILLHLLGEKEASIASVRRGMALVGEVQDAYFLLGLSSAPGTEGRASDEAGLRGVEIEELLAEAMSQVPSAAETGDAEDRTQVAENAEEQHAEVATRAGGTKAAEVGAVADRLFWMTVPEGR